MLVYHRFYMVTDINEGSLLYPTIYTLHLNNAESEILLDVHHTYMCTDYINRLDIKIYNHCEEYAKGLYRICGVIRRVKSVDSRSFVVDITYSGLEAHIKLPRIFEREFVNNGTVSIIMNNKK